VNLPLDFLRRNARAMHRKFPGLTEDDAFQVGAECWLLQPEDLTPQLRGSRAYWAMFNAGLLTIYSSIQEARREYKKRWRQTPKGREAHCRAENARNKRRRASARAQKEIRG